MVKRRLMAIGAHADDIELNVGGTLLKYRKHDYDIVYVMSTNNMSGHWKHRQPDGTWKGKFHPYYEMQPQRKLEADNAARESFGTQCIHLDHPQRHYIDHEGKRVKVTYGAPRPDCVKEGQPTILTAHEYPECVKQVADLILEHQPEVVLTNGPTQVDMEHVGTCLLVSKGYRMAAEQGYQGMLLHWLDMTCGLPGSLFGRGFARWDTFVDVSNEWPEQQIAIDHHASAITAALNVEYPQWGPACGCERVETFTVADWGAQPNYNSALAQELVANTKFGCMPQAVPANES